MKDWVSDPRGKLCAMPHQGPDLWGVLILFDVALLGNFEFLSRVVGKQD